MKNLFGAFSGSELNKLAGFTWFVAWLFILLSTSLGLLFISTAFFNISSIFGILLTNGTSSSFSGVFWVVMDWFGFGTGCEDGEDGTEVEILLDTLFIGLFVSGIGLLIFISWEYRVGSTFFISSSSCLTVSLSLIILSSSTFCMFLSLTLSKLLACLSDIWFFKTAFWTDSSNVNNLNLLEIADWDKPIFLANSSWVI